MEQPEYLRLFIVIGIGCALEMRKKQSEIGKIKYRKTKKE